MVLLAISVTNQLAISTVLIQVDDDLINPLFEVIYPAFASGNFERANLATFLLGVEGLWSVVPQAAFAAGLTGLLARRLRHGTVEDALARQC